MARAGRPQGAPKGRTEAANELAAFLCEVTHGLTVRELAQRYGGGKTAWGEYRSGARLIALGRLNTVLKDQVRDSRRLEGLLGEARRLHDRALAAEASGRPAPSVAQALRQARADLAESGRLVENLLAMVTLLRERADGGGPAYSGTEPDDFPPRAEGRSGHTPSQEAESATAEQVRLRLDQAVDQLVAARSVQAAARRAVADAEAQREAAAPRGVEIQPDAEELAEEHATPQDRTTSQDATPPGGTPPDVERTGSAPPAVPGAHRFPPVADAALSLELVRIGNTLKQQRADARWLDRRIRRLPSGSLPGPAAPAAFRPYVVEGVVLERLDKSVVPASRAPALRPRAALPAIPDPQGGPRARKTLALLGTVTALALLAAATLAGVLLGRGHTTAAPGTTVYQGPGALTVPPPATGPGTASPSPSASPSSAPPSPSPGPTRTPSGHTPTPPVGRAPALPLPALATSPNPSAERASGTAYVVSQDRRNILRWTAGDRSWKVIGPAADQIYAGIAGLFATDPDDGHISRYDERSRSWSQIGFPGEQFVTAGDGLYAITEHRDAVMRWSGIGSEWVRIGGPAARLYAGGAGVFATSPDAGGLFRYSGYGDTWVEAGGPGADFAVGPDYVARLSPDGKEIWQANGRGSGWRRIGGPAHRLHAGGAGLFATDGASGRILKYDGVPGSWTPIGAAGAALAVTGTSVYRIAADGRTVSRWTGRGSEWVPLGTTASAIAAMD